MESPKKSPATDLDRLKEADQKSVQLFWETDHFWKRLGIKVIWFLVFLLVDLIITMCCDLPEEFRGIHF